MNHDKYNIGIDISFFFKVAPTSHYTLKNNKMWNAPIFSPLTIGSSFPPKKYIKNNIFLKNFEWKLYLKSVCFSSWNYFYIERQLSVLRTTPLFCLLYKGEKNLCISNDCGLHNNHNCILPLKYLINLCKFSNILLVQLRSHIN